MPIISSFFGIYVRMYFADHGPPHIHVNTRDTKLWLPYLTVRSSRAICPGGRQLWCGNGVSTTGRNWSKIGPRHRHSSRWSASPEQTMIKLTNAEYKEGYKILLRFSDGSWGIYDFAELVKTKTVMTAPLLDVEFFRHFFIELGALAWPNGFDLSAVSLQKRLDEKGGLHRDAAAA